MKPEDRDGSPREENAETLGKKGAKSAAFAKSRKSVEVAKKHNN